MLLDVVVQRNGELRKQACMAAWNLVLGGGGEQAGVNGMKSVLSGHDDELVTAVLEGLGIVVEGSEEKKLAFVEQFGNGWVLSLLRSYSSAGVRLKAVLMKLATTLNDTFRHRFPLSLNRVSHQVAKSEASYNRGNQWDGPQRLYFSKTSRFLSSVSQGAHSCPFGYQE